ncbi:hypothetical protein Tco_1327009 [Tanacetum coccineum]
METSRPAPLQELSLYGTQFVAAVVIDKSSGNTSVKPRTMGISLILGILNHLLMTILSQLLLGQPVLAQNHIKASRSSNESMNSKGLNKRIG